MNHWAVRQRIHSFLSLFVEFLRLCATMKDLQASFRIRFSLGFAPYFSISALFCRCVKQRIFGVVSSWVNPSRYSLAWLFSSCSNSLFFVPALPSTSVGSKISESRLPRTSLEILTIIMFKASPRKWDRSLRTLKHVYGIFTISASDHAQYYGGLIDGEFYWLLFPFTIIQPWIE